MNRFVSTLIKIPKIQPRFAFSDILKERDKGEERIYFTKEDQKLMQKLLKKMKESNEVPKGQAQNEKQDKEELQNILSRYRITHNEGLVEELLRWKRND